MRSRNDPLLLALLAATGVLLTGFVQGALSVSRPRTIIPGGARGGTPPQARLPRPRSMIELEEQWIQDSGDSTFSEYMETHA